jgi:putative hydrolase of the HAD superfamily
VIKALLFDLDGTLVDHDGAAEVALDQALRETAGVREADHGRARHRWKELEALAMDRYLAGELTFGEQRRLRTTSLAAELGLGEWNTERADNWFARYLRHYEDAWRTYPDVAPALDALTDLRLGVLTNGDAGQQRRKLHRVGLAASLPTVIASSEAGAAKPDPKIFHYACDLLHLTPPEVAYVGDRQKTDALAATDAGLRGIWLNRGGDRGIRTLEELPALLT